MLSVWGTKPRIFSGEELENFEDMVFWLLPQLQNDQASKRVIEIQRSLLPQSNLTISGYEMVGFCHPHYSTGGDYYDWLETIDGAAFMLADVMGKGMLSAITAVALRATFRTASLNHYTEQVMNIASQVLEPDLQRAGSFVTLIYGQLNTFLNQVRYIDAGHGLATHVTKDGKITTLTTSNYPIGTGQNVEWQILNIEMAHGDTLILVSDGVLDIFDESQDALKEIADMAVAANSAQKFIDELKEILSNAVVSDDVTALILRRT